VKPFDDRSKSMRTEDGYIIHKCLNGEKEAFGFLVEAEGKLPTIWGEEK